MTKQEWLNRADGAKDKLKNLIKEYHPIYRQAGRRKDIDYITALNAEIACTKIRKEIQDSTPENFQPEIEFQLALDTQDVRKAESILSAVWFGVPESTLCWKIPGFSECVELLEDPPS